MNADCIYNLLGFASHPGVTMTVKIDEVEPNIFPDVDDLDARDAGRHVEVFLDVRIEDKHTPVTVKLSYEQASAGHSSGAVPKALPGACGRSAFRGMTDRRQAVAN